jgi:KDO2-lipid IV(A) lauroyltransferase
MTLFERMLRALAHWPLPLMQALGAALGWLTYAASPTYRRRMRAHVAQAGLPWAQARAAVGHAGRMVAELPYLWLRPQGMAIGDRVQWDGAERVDAALAQGKGLLLVTPHVGAFEAIGQSYAERWGVTHPMTALYRPARKAALQRLVAQSRQRPGMLTAPANMAGVRLMIKSLRQGHVVGMLPDQVPPEGQGVWAPWFGRPAYTMTLLARLIQQAGCPWLITLCERLPGGRYTVHVIEPGDILPAGGDAAECAAAINRLLEGIVLRVPGQYLWSYNRYKQPRSGDAPPA